MTYSQPRDFSVRPRKSLRIGQKKPNRARRYRLNPERRTVEENRKTRHLTRFLYVAAQLDGIGVC